MAITGFVVADELLRCASSLTELARLNFYELTTIPGVGSTTAARLQATIELACRLRQESPDPKPQVRSPGDVASLLQVEMSLLDHEQLRVVLLDTKNRVQEVVMLYKGSLNTAVIRIGEVFKQALKRNSAAIVVVHNHPSGDPTPSPKMYASPRRLSRPGNYSTSTCSTIWSSATTAMSAQRARAWLLVSYRTFASQAKGRNSPFTQYAPRG